MSVLASIAVPAALREAVSERAWLEAMLDAERALANAESLAGVIPADAAAAIAEKCRAGLYDWDELALVGRAAGNPAEPLVRALRERVGGEAARFVHFGATSQDVVDSAAMLVARRSLDLVLADVDGVAAACAQLATRHRSAPAAGRTLLQQAVPITFGLRAAGWLVLALDARRALRRVELAAQLGGAAGTLAPLGGRGPEVVRLYAAELGLVEPLLPWHANRTRIAELSGALDLAAGALAKVALDVALLSQPEIAEVAEAAAGGSSTMPQKRNPVGSTLVRACAAQVHGHAQALFAAVAAQELERGAGAWHAEWDALSGALAFAGGAASALRGVVEGLEVDVERMRGNLHESTLAERLAFQLAERHGRDVAHGLVAEAVRSGRPLREALAGELPDAVLDEALNPATYLGSAETFVDRALARYEEER